MYQVYKLWLEFRHSTVVHATIQMADFIYLPSVSICVSHHYLVQQYIEFDQPSSVSGSKSAATNWQPSTKTDKCKKFMIIFGEEPDHQVVKQSTRESSNISTYSDCLVAFDDSSAAGSNSKSSRTSASIKDSIYEQVDYADIPLSVYKLLTPNHSFVDCKIQTISVKAMPTMINCDQVTDVLVSYKPEQICFTYFTHLDHEEDSNQAESKRLMSRWTHFLSDEQANGVAHRPRSHQAHDMGNQFKRHKKLFVRVNRNDPTEVNPEVRILGVINFTALNKGLNLNHHSGAESDPDIETQFIIETINLYIHSPFKYPFSIQRKLSNSYRATLSINQTRRIIYSNQFEELLEAPYESGCSNYHDTVFATYDDCYNHKCAQSVLHQFNCLIFSGNPRIELPLNAVWCNLKNSTLKKLITNHCAKFNGYSECPPDCHKLYYNFKEDSELGHNRKSKSAAGAGDGSQGQMNAMRSNQAMAPGSGGSNSLAMGQGVKARPRPGTPKNSAIFTVSHDSVPEISFKTKPKMELIEFLSIAGGLAGMWLGGSVYAFSGRLYHQNLLTIITHKCAGAYDFFPI